MRYSRICYFIRVYTFSLDKSNFQKLKCNEQRNLKILPFDTSNCIKAHHDCIKVNQFPEQRGCERASQMQLTPGTGKHIKPGLSQSNKSTKITKTPIRYTYLKLFCVLEIWICCHLSYIVFKVWQQTTENRQINLVLKKNSSIKFNFCYHAKCSAVPV